jgi:pSer/pThr/pTyr-binding forkhead associated (FHA) protein
MRLVIVSVTRNRKGQPVRVARTLDGESFAGGRGARCEVHLPDPRVALEHATIYRSEGKIRLTAVGTAKLLVDGRPIPRRRSRPDRASRSARMR